MTSPRVSRLHNPPCMILTPVSTLLARLSSLFRPSHSCSATRPAICGLHLFLCSRLLRSADLWAVLLTTARRMSLYVCTCVPLRLHRRRPGWGNYDATLLPPTPAWTYPRHHLPLLPAQMLRELLFPGYHSGVFASGRILARQETVTKRRPTEVACNGYY